MFFFSSIDRSIVGLSLLSSVVCCACAVSSSWVGMDGDGGASILCVVLGTNQFFFWVHVCGWHKGLLDDGNPWVCGITTIYYSSG